MMMMMMLWMRHGRGDRSRTGIRMMMGQPCGEWSGGTPSYRDGIGGVGVDGCG